MRARFGIEQRLDFYASGDLVEIVRRTADVWKVEIDDQGAQEIARRARGTPRVANRLLRRMRDYAQVRAKGVITLEVARRTLQLLDVDEYGLGEMDGRILRAIIEKFDGGPVGIQSIAAAVGEDPDTLEQGFEPFLVQNGFLERTSRGRVATVQAYKHWWTDGEYVWFRRSASNPETLKRNNEFCRTGDYKHVETQGDVEIYQLQPKSPFAVKKSVDIGQMDTYNVRRQAVKAACRRDWKGFRDIMTFLRERINATYVSPNKPGVTPLADNIFAEQYIAVLTAIDMRHGPSPDEINRELMNLAGGPKRMNQSKIISIGGNA
jgi:hypothetical protein